MAIPPLPHGATVLPASYPVLSVRHDCELFDVTESSDVWQRQINQGLADCLRKAADVVDALGGWHIVDPRVCFSGEESRTWTFYASLVVGR